MLSNAYFLAKFGFDTAENEPCQVCPIPREKPFCHVAGASRGDLDLMRGGDVLRNVLPRRELQVTELALLHTTLHRQHLACRLQF